MMRVLLLLPFLPAMRAEFGVLAVRRPPHPPRRRSVVHRPRHAAPPKRQARAIPPRIPNYAEFAATAEAHSALWEITYEYSSSSPYRARNRVTGHVVAVSDLDLLDHILATYEPPHPVRGYYGQQTRGRIRAYLNSGGL